MMHTTYLISILLFIVKLSNAVDVNCDFKQTIKAGETYSITNPDYPGVTTGPRSCRWYAISDERIRVSCDEFYVSPSQDCRDNSLNIFLKPQSSPLRYCGFTNVTAESSSGEVILSLTASTQASRSRFRCYIQAVDSNKCKCGWKKPIKIVGGEETKVNEFPMMAGIYSSVTQRIFCGGTVIANSYILTAAHCLNEFTANDILIDVGDHDLTTVNETNATRLYKVMRIIKHPLYNSNRKDYDVAIIKIRNNLKYSNEIGPACLPFQHYLDSFGGSFVNMIGWGTTEFAGAPSDVLRKVKLSIINLNDCKEFYPGLNYRQVCTFAKGKDACQLDSGGPVLWQNPTTRRLVLIGIISYGGFCGSSQPGVNTRVGSFIDWIVENTQDAEYCQEE